MFYLYLYSQLSNFSKYMYFLFLFINHVSIFFSGSSAISNENFILEIKKHCFDFLMNQVGDENIHYIPLLMPEMFDEEFEQIAFFYSNRKCRFGFGPFTVVCGMSSFHIFIC